MEKVYFGNFKEESKRNGGWFIGHFFDGGLRKRGDIEIKYWEFSPGKCDHDKKMQNVASEITLILKGKIEGMIDGENIKLEAGDYVIITPKIINGFPNNVLDYAEGITIKIPSVESDKITDSEILDKYLSLK